jgi:dTMP kinase
VSRQSDPAISSTRDGPAVVIGRFVTFEGGEGSGKTTQLERLAARLRRAGHDPVVTREPGGTPLAEAIRELLLDPERQPGAMTEALLMVAARAEVVPRLIRPALESGRIVMCDRYGDSTLAYQGGGRGIDADLLRAMNRAATLDLVPDLTLLYDLDPEIGAARRSRAAGATNRLDRESLDFHRRVRARYLELASHEPERFVVLDATADADELEERGWSALAAMLAGGRSPTTAPGTRRD